jgi:putative transcriptional regulator
MSSNKIKVGGIIKSTQLLINTFFKNSYIIITAINADGATGFVLNKLFNKPLNALQEFSHVKHINLYQGGPVDNEHLFFIHKRNDVIDNGELLTDDIYLGGNFTEAITAINNSSIIDKDIKIFIGYCGWDAGELQAEIEEGSWEVLDLQPEIF